MNDFSFPESDDLNQMINAPIDPVRATKAAAAEQAKIGYVEKCPKCRGTGRFTGWSGRSFGQCFACKGNGSRTFKQPAAKRIDNRVKAQARKATKLEMAITAFKEEHPAVWDWMNGSTFEFAVALRGGLEQYGSLTEKQLAAAYRCVAKQIAFKEAAAARAVVRVEAAPTIDLTKIEAAFSKAAEHMQKPILRFAGLQVSIAPAAGKNAGALYVKADGQYMGKISGGKFICTRECDDATKARVIESCQDPKNAAITYGRQTGSCSCCGRLLTDPVSVEAGIGPICAGNYGWG